LGKIGAVEGKISLQEAQHVITCQHEFKDWNWPHAVAALGLYLLIGCQDRDLVVLLRESDGRDIVYALARTSEDLRERFLSCVSERLQGFLREEMSFLEELSDEQVADAQRRILLHAALYAQGQLTWPQSRSAPPRILSLDAVDTAPLVREAIILMVDGTEPNLLADILETRSQHAMLGGQEKRGRMVIETLLAIYSGDNPRIVHHKLLTFFVDYRAPVSGVERPEQRPPEQIQERIDLRITRDLAEMDYGEIAALFTDMAYTQTPVRTRCVAPLYR
jgi:hypothetical protein